MDDLPTHDPGGQGLRLRYHGQHPVKGFPDTKIAWWESIDIPYGVGSSVQLFQVPTPEGAQDLAFAVGYSILRIDSIPSAEVHAGRLASGEMLPFLVLRGEWSGAPLDHARRLTDRYEAVLGRIIAGEIGRPPDSFDIYLAQLRGAFYELRERCSPRA